MYCENCEFWRKIDTSKTPNEPDQGFCRLNPPSGQLDNGKYMTVRRITAPDDECGMGEFVSIFLAKNKK